MRFFLLIFGLAFIGTSAVSGESGRNASDYLDICGRADSVEDLTAKLQEQDGWKVVTPDVQNARTWWDGDGRPTVEELAMIANFSIQYLSYGDPKETARAVQSFMSGSTPKSRIMPLADYDDAVTLFDEARSSLLMVDGIGEPRFRDCFYVSLDPDIDESLLIRYGQLAKTFGSLARGSARLSLNPQSDDDWPAGAVYVARQGAMERGLGISLGNLSMFFLWKIE